MREMVMGMMKGDINLEGLGDMSKMFDSMGGVPGGGMPPGMDEAAMREMMAGIAGGGGGGGGDGGMFGGSAIPDNMSPEEVSAMIAEQVSDLKRQLDAGYPISPEEVKDLEKSMGIDIGMMKTMIKMAKAAGATSSIPNFDDLVEIFEKLDKQKK